MNQNLILAKQKHEAWLIKNGVHPTQIKSRKKVTNKKSDFGVAKSYYADQSNNMTSGANVLPVRSIWEIVRNGEESPETIAAIKEKASRVGPSFNKGATQLIPKNEIIYAGRK